MRLETIVTSVYSFPTPGADGCTHRNSEFSRTATQPEIEGVLTAGDVMRVNYGQTEAEFGGILRQNRSLTASLKAITLAPSMEDGSGLLVILPDIIAIDDKGQGWRFEVNRNADWSLPV